MLRTRRRPDFPEWSRAWRAKGRWDRRFEDWAVGMIGDLRRELPDEGELVRLAGEVRSGTTKRWRPVAAAADSIDVGALASRIGAITQTDPLVQGSLVTYLGVARAAGEEAGQFSLDALGINRTFAWANPRNMAQALYAVRGSKVVQLAHGTHVSELSKIVARATDPSRPLAIGDVTREIREKWDGLERWQAERIARTETAAVWETTNYNVMRANGVESFDSLIASGPSIGVDVEDACDICQEIAAGAPYGPDDLADLPPFHPNCRCTLVPHEDVLPPREPWAGEEMSICGDDSLELRKQSPTLVAKQASCLIQTPSATIGKWDQSRLERNAAVEAKDVQRATEGPKVLDADEKGILQYVGRDYRPLNRVLREEQAVPESLQTIVNSFQKYMAPIREDIVVSRGAGSGTAFGENLSRNLIGSVIEDKGYMSTTYLKNLLHLRDSKVILRMRVPKGTRAFAMKRSSSLADEGEVVLDAGTKYIVRDVIQEEATVMDQVVQKTILYVEVIL